MGTTENRLPPARATGRGWRRNIIGKTVLNGICVSGRSKPQIGFPGQVIEGSNFCKTSTLKIVRKILSFCKGNCQLSGHSLDAGGTPDRYHEPNKRFLSFSDLRFRYRLWVLKLRYRAFKFRHFFGMNLVEVRDFFRMFRIRLLLLCLQLRYFTRMIFLQVGYFLAKILGHFGG